MTKAHLSEIMKRAFGIRAPTEWNNVPLVLNPRDSVDSFKVVLKPYIFNVPIYSLN